MTNTRRLIIGSAASVVMTSMGLAADLPTAKAGSVEYARICAAYGRGFFYIHGLDTCIRLSGRARFEYVASSVANKSLDPSSFEARGRMAVDTRTTTDWGLLRTYFRVEFSRASGYASAGSFGSGSSARDATKFGFGGGASDAASGFPSFAGADTAGNRLQTGLAIDAAFVQWGGLTAGRIQSFYDFYPSSESWYGITESDVKTQALAYTYAFGAGFSATLSIEDPKERQQFPVAGYSVGAIGGINPTTAIPGFVVVYPFAFSPFAAPNLVSESIYYTQREGVPDVVAALRVDQGWGAAQLSGAYHRVATEGSMVNSLNPAIGGGFVANPVVPSVNGGYGAVSGNGWAIQGGVKFDLPAIASGDTLYLQAAYARGALSYVNSGYTPTFTGGANSTGGTTFATYDAVVGPSGRLTLTLAYSALISFLHYWTPSLRSALFAGAEHISYSTPIRNAAGFAMGAACPTCLGTAVTGDGAFYNPFSPYYTGGTQYNAGANLIWSPVRDLDIGVELFYIRNHMAHSQYDVNSGVGEVTKGDDAWRLRMRVQRDF